MSQNLGLIKNVADKMFDKNNVYQDNAIRTPEHDKMVFKLMEDNVINNIVKLCKIDTKSHKIDIETGGQLPSQGKGKSVNVSMISPPRYKAIQNEDGMVVSRRVIFEREADLTSTIQREIIKELKENNIPTDGDLKCAVDSVFTIAGVEWLSAPKQMRKFDEVTKRQAEPKTFSAVLRTDLESEICPTQCLPAGAPTENKQDDEKIDLHWEIQPEHFFITDRGFQIGRVDVVAYNKDVRIVLFLEIKPEIINIQEVIGQVKKYRECRNDRIQKIIYADSIRGWKGYLHREVTDIYDAYYIVISRSVTDMQRTYLGKADIYLIDEKDLIDDIVKDGEVEVGEKDKI